MGLLPVLNQFDEPECALKCLKRERDNCVGTLMEVLFLYLLSYGVATEHRVFCVFMLQFYFQQLIKMPRERSP